MSKYKYDFTLDAMDKNNSHIGLASRIKPNERILELGCSYGYLSKFLKDELFCHVTGVDIDPEAIQQATNICDQAFVANLDDQEWLSKIKGQKFDVVLCADILEHLKTPETLLKTLKPFLSTDARILASVPNVAHASVRLELLQGHFDYEELGILDDTHLHFYTRDSLIALFMKAGYVCCDIAYTLHDLTDEAISQNLINAGLALTEAALKLLHAPDAVAYQFIIEARPAKAELIKNLPKVLSPKPLVSSGVLFAELKATIANLEEHNKNHLLHIQRLEEALSSSSHGS